MTNAQRRYDKQEAIRQANRELAVRQIEHVSTATVCPDCDGLGCRLCGNMGVVHPEALYLRNRITGR